MHLETYLPRLSRIVADLDRAMVRAYIQELDAARRRGADVWFCGNGGSASTASHVICDLNKFASGPNAPPFRAHSLNDSISTMLAVANDVAYEQIFAAQLRNFLRPDDLLVAISGSGNSPNVLAAVAYAKSIGARTVGITGFAGGKLKAMADLSVHVPVNDMQIAEDVHMMIQHAAAQALQMLAA